MLPLQVLTVVLPAMSSKKEEREENRAAAAASICPGWIVQSLGSWTPRQNKPELKHLRPSRNRTVPLGARVPPQAARERARETRGALFHGRVGDLG